jgi:hypothetical protein
MNNTESMIDECIDLATIMRPFLMKKRGAVVMTTLCMLAAEAIVNTTVDGRTKRAVHLMNLCVEDYVGQLLKAADDPA